MEYIDLGYFGLFLICFLAATILPLASEGVLLLFLAAAYDPIYCLFVATTGNTLGGLTNYFLGLLGNRATLKAVFRSKSKYRSFKSNINKYGYWLGALTWLPFIGDPLTIALGFFRVKFIPFLLLMTLSKGLRYYIIIFIWSQ